MKIFDTIAAVATPVGVGGIAIIRISGDEAERAAEKIVFARCGKPVSQWKSHMLHLSDIRRSSDGTPIDEALVSVMRAPNSYTGENVVEINCHGGYLSASLIMEELFRVGVRQAEAGEFTRRAFMNGKCDLAKAEAAADLIHASSALGQSNAARVLSGALSEKVGKIRESVLSLAAAIAAATDFPEEVGEMPREELQSELEKIKYDISEMLCGFEKGRIIRDGLSTAIVGRPNVGKSSLLNALSRSRRAIVTDIPGTTRDTVEEFVSVGGIALRLIDTAGIRESGDAVEQIGIERARESINEADLCLLVLDSSDEICADDIEIRRRAEDKNLIVILNKTDKCGTIDVSRCAQILDVDPKSIVKTATPDGHEAEGIDDLEAMIAERYLAGGISKDDVFISNDRQKNALISAQRIVDGMLSGLSAGVPSDLLFVDLEDAAEALGEVCGMTVSDEIIDEVFERFCVGK